MANREWFDGSCHCGRIRFQVRPRTRRAIECNCSVCDKKAFLHLIVSASDFRLVEGKAHIETYTFNTGVAQHYFCRHCGVHPFYVPRSHPQGFSANLRCLDSELLSTFHIDAFDGRHWEQHVREIQQANTAS